MKRPTKNRNERREDANQPEMPTQRRNERCERIATVGSSEHSGCEPIGVGFPARSFSVGFSILLITLLIATVITSCSNQFKELTIPEPTDFDESDIIEMTITPSTTAFITTQTTRAEEPTDGATEIENDFEKTIDNIWVFQYHAVTKNLLIKPRYYKADKHADTDGNWTVVLKPDIESIVYVVTNVNDNTWAAYYAEFMTPDDLLEATLPFPETIDDVSETAYQGHIPMQGYVQGTPTKGGTVTVPVERMYAKVKVRIIIDPLLQPYDVEINSLEMSSSPFYCRIGTIYDPNSDAECKDYEYPENTTWVSRSMTTDDKGTGNNIDDPNNALLPDDEVTYDYVIYIPENIQGETVNLNEDTKGDFLPSNHASRLDLRITYVDADGVSDSREYVVYPGGNSTNNFNIRRNQVYRVSMTLGYPIDPEVGIFANCYVTKPGKTISFEPYKNEGDGKGGGYSYADYINPEDEDKRIDKIEILWQTEDCIGDNSEGNLVYFTPSDPQEETDKIYVTANAPGNAVIAAYNSSDTIIWSWHIWVSNEDPTNLSNAVTYYTYDWDEDGIYGYGMGHAMVPGYALMTCNLGALGSKPTATTGEGAVIPYGLMYQWGRKDPFPALKGAASGAHNTTYTEYGAYNENTTEYLYDNSHQRITGMTDDTDTDKLFHSVTATEIINNDYGIKFAIQNPTVFMCATTLAAQHSANYVAGQNTDDSYNAGKGNYPTELAGDWQMHHDDRLWGAIPTDDVKCYTYSTTKTRDGEYAHLYDDYGEKSIFDPCPAGWRVSPPDQWLSFTIDGKNPSSANYATNINYDGSAYGYGLYMYIQAWRSGPQSYFPTQGTRAPDGSGGRPIRCGNYHNATADPSTMQRVNILHIHNGGDFNIFEVGIIAYYVKSVAGPVRCVRTEK